jgi:hypothetical protein
VSTQIRLCIVIIIGIIILIIIVFKDDFVNLFGLEQEIQKLHEIQLVHESTIGSLSLKYQSYRNQIQELERKKNQQKNCSLL